MQSLGETIPMMVGTAGHVDHGKTSLVGLLTGCETDTLQEEKTRGLSIDLGFAAYWLDQTHCVGIVDVPGHLDFIKNMVAGAYALDLVMLVIAADDGIMPQTEEHLTIIKALTNARIMCVITKIDLVNQSRCETLRNEIKAFLKEKGEKDPTVVMMSNTTLDGLQTVKQTLKSELEAVLKIHQETNLNQIAFRMPIERVFSIQGYGTILSGIPISGSAKIGETLEVLPLKKEGKIRGIQSYKMKTNTVFKHACSAINLASCTTEHIQRGMMLCAKDCFECTQIVIVHFNNLSDKPLETNAQLKFHSGTLAVNCKILPLNTLHIPPHGEGFMQIKFDYPLQLIATDRFILRTHSPSKTIGGGIILSAQNQRFKRTEKKLHERLKRAKNAVEKADPITAELEFITNDFFKADQLTKTTGIDSQSIEKTLKNNSVIKLEKGHFFYLKKVDEMIEKIKRFLNRFHFENPTRVGANLNEVALAFNMTLSDLQYFIKNPHLKQVHDYLALAHFKPKRSNQLEQECTRVLDFLTTSKEKIPTQNTIQLHFHLNTQRFSIIKQSLLDEKKIVEIENLLIQSTLYHQLIEAILSIQSPTIEINELREKTNISRNIAVSLLDHCDAIGLSTRQNGVRTLSRRK